MQQFPLIDLFIDLFEFALHVSGDKLVHLQEHFLTVYINSVHCTETVYTVKKCTWRWASLSPETCRANSNRSIKRSISGNCCILSIAYTIVQQIHIDKIRMFYHILRFITYLFRSLLRPLSACFTRILIKCNYSINKTTYAIWAIVAFYRCSWWWSLNRPNQVGED